MEDDDPTPRALPRWVELEYKVSLKLLSSVIQPTDKYLTYLLLGLAHVHSCWPRRVSRIHTPIKRSGRRPHYCSSFYLHRLRAQTRARSMPRRGRASADASAGDRTGSGVPARSQGAAGAL